MKASPVGTLCSLAGTLFLLAGTVQAQLVWTGNVNNAWDTTSANWVSGGSSAAYADGSDVMFTDRTLQPTVNVTFAVSPHSVLISNSTTRTLIFTNNVIGGGAVLAKDGNGTVRFGGTTTNLYVYNTSFLFTGGTTIKNGTLGYFLGNTDDSAKATGGVPYGFGTGPITLAGTNCTLAFSGWKGSSQLTNDLVSTGGGTVDLGRWDSYANSQNNLSGNLLLQSTNLLTIKGSFTAYGAASDKANRVCSGVTTLATNATLAINNNQYSTRSFAYEQDIRATNTSYALAIQGQGMASIEFSGNNTGVVAGITVMPYNTFATAPVLFLSTNAMGGAPLTVKSGSYAGLQFGIPSDIFSRLSLENGAALGFESNTTIDVDLSASGINRDIWLGSYRGCAYSGNLTPSGSTYRFGGGGCVDQTTATATSMLILTRTNALSGARNVIVGDTTSFLQPGVLVLAASNSFTGGIALNGSRSQPMTSTSTQPTASPTLIVRAAGALGTGSVTINRNTSSSVAPTLQFETVPQVVANDILITNTAGASILNAAVPVVLRGNLTSTGPSNLNIQTAAAYASLLAFDQASAGHAVTLGSGSIINQSYGLFDPGAAANLPTTSGYRMDANAMLVLSPGFTWANLTAGRTWVNSSTPAAGQWTGRNFAARGTNQTIDATGSFQTGTDTNWLDQSILLGSSVTNVDGTFYANAGVKIARGWTITGDRLITVASTGPGLTNASSLGIVHEIAGTVTGPGMLRLASSGVGSDGQLAELVLSGPALWTGSVNLDYQSSQRIITGPGGLGICQANPGGFIRFNGAASIPTNNGGVSAFLAAIGRSWGDNHFGYLLGGTAAGETYTLRSGYRFLLGGANRAVLGGASGSATLGDAMLTIWNSTSASTTHSLNLLARDADAVLTLGSPTGSVRFSSAYCAGNSSGAGLQAAGTPATTLTERPVLNTLIKRGPGSLVLQNVRYTQLDGTGDTTANYAWQLGGGVSGTFDGVVRETGTAASNSLRAMTWVMNGGILGLAADYAATAGTNAGRINMSGVAGAGFAAYGARRVVTMSPQGSDNLNWGQTGAANNDFFMNSSAPLILNAPDADAEIEFALASPTNYIRLGTGLREIRVLDNSASTADRAVVSARISNTSGSCGLVKTGSGTLVLTSTNNDWGGVTWVSNGTLLVNGMLAGNSPSNVTVCSGATLGGTGRVLRVASVLSGGTLAAGMSGSGMLTVSNLTLQSGSTAAFTLGAVGGYAGVNVLSNLTVAGTLALTFTNQPAGGTVYNLFDWASRSGTFDNVTISGSLRADRVNLDKLYTTGEVSIRQPAGTALLFF